MRALGRGLGIMLGFGMVLGSGVASARRIKLTPEVPKGSRIPVQPTVSAVPEAREILFEFAQCAVQKRRDLAAQFILDTSSINITKQYMILADNDCMTGVAARKDTDVEMRLPGDIMRFAVAEALVRADLGAFDPAQVSRAQPLQYPTIDPADYVPRPGIKYTPKGLAGLQRAKGVDQSRIAFQRYGECVARTDPVNVRILTFAKPSSPDEATAIKALLPTFSDCLAAGQQFETNKTMMRGTLALAYCRLARAPKKPVEAAK